MERRRISICIPTYQRPEILRRTLAHLAEIDRMDMEVVVSDNASEDGTEEVVQSFEGKFPALRYHCQSENRDAPNNIQTALSLATGCYAYVLSDDDQIVPEGILAAIEMLDARPEVVAVYGGHQEWDADTDKVLTTAQKVREPVVFKPSDKLRVIQRFSGFQFPVVRTELFQRFCFYDNYTRTRPVLSRIMSLGSIAVIPEPLYRHAHTHPRREYHLTEGWFHDKIRAEYELFFADLDVDYSDSKQVEGVTRFIRERTTPAYLQGVRFGKIKGEPLTQRHFLLRARAYGLVTEDQLVEWEQQNIFHVVADRLRTILECLPQVRRLVIESTPVLSHFARVLSRLLQNREVEVISVKQDQWLKRAADDSEFLLAEKHKTVAERIRYLDGNVPPGHHAALFDLIASLRLTRKQLNLTV